MNAISEVRGFPSKGFNGRCRVIIIKRHTHLHESTSLAERIHYDSSMGLYF